MNFLEIPTALWIKREQVHEFETSYVGPASFFSLNYVAADSNHSHLATPL